MWKVWWGRGGWSWESNKSGVNIVSWSQHEGENKTRWYGVVTYHVLTYHGHGGLDGIVWYGMVKGYGRVEGTKQASSCNNSPPTPCHDYHTYHLLFCDDWWWWLWFWYFFLYADPNMNGNILWDYASGRCFALEDIWDIYVYLLTDSSDISPQTDGSMWICAASNRREGN